MAYQGSNNTVKPAGPCDLYREQLLLNPTLYGGNDADDFRFNSTIAGLPTRTSHTIDTTAYPLGSVRTDNWIEHLRGKQGLTNDTNSQV